VDQEEGGRAVKGKGKGKERRCSARRGRQRDTRGWADSARRITKEVKRGERVMRRGDWKGLNKSGGQDGAGYADQEGVWEVHAIWAWRGWD
jgi:hypothetical protein